MVKNIKGVVGSYCMKHVSQCPPSTEVRVEKTKVKTLMGKLREHLIDQNSPSWSMHQPPLAIGWNCHFSLSVNISYIPIFPREEPWVMFCGIPKYSTLRNVLWSIQIQGSCLQREIQTRIWVLCHDYSPCGLWIRHVLHFQCPKYFYVLTGLGMMNIRWLAEDIQNSSD